MKNNIILGIITICACQFMWSLHYATVKWLAGGYSVYQLLCVRSVFMALIVTAIKPTALRRAISSPHKRSMTVRALLQIAATFCFFLAAKGMGLSEVTTLNATAPLIVVLLSIVFLREASSGFKWTAVGIGLVGTAIAAAPSGEAKLAPTLLGLASGLLWALTVILTRKDRAKESNSVQLLATAFAFGVVSALFADWKAPVSWEDGGLMVVLGAEVYLAQLFFVEAYRRAPASLIAPLEYSTVVWSCILGFAIFHDMPAAHVVVGAFLIILSGIAIGWGEHAAHRKSKLQSLFHSGAR
jgi:S-adenosylmethionine uptake transporter